MAITTDQIADLAKTTLKELGRGKWTDLTLDLQELIAMPHLLKERRVTFDSGRELQWQIMIDHNSQANRPGLFAVDNYNYKDVFIQGSVPWRHANSNWALDRRLITMNGGISKIVDIVKAQRAACWISLAKMLEDDFWGKPTDSTDTVKAWGVDMAIVKNATEGFNGGNPSGFTSGYAGVSSTTYPRWRNWTYQYTNITKADLVKGWRNAATKTKFMAPIDVPEYATSMESDYVYYTNWDVLTELETILEDQNENLGNDLDSKHGTVMFRRRPVVWVPKLDADAQDPVYGINWKAFSPCFLKGEYMRESDPHVSYTSHVTVVSDVDLTYNYKAYDRRKLFILNKA